MKVKTSGKKISHTHGNPNYGGGGSWLVSDVSSFRHIIF